MVNAGHLGPQHLVTTLLVIVFSSFLPPFFPFLSLSLLLSSFWLNQEGIHCFIEINDQSLVLPGS